jgi:hypothetical protein
MQFHRSAGFWAPYSQTSFDGMPNKASTEGPPTTQAYWTSDITSPKMSIVSRLLTSGVSHAVPPCAIALDAGERMDSCSPGYLRALHLRKAQLQRRYIRGITNLLKQEEDTICALMGCGSLTIAHTHDDVPQDVTCVFCGDTIHKSSAPSSDVTWRDRRDFHVQFEALLYIEGGEGTFWGKDHATLPAMAHMECMFPPSVEHA